MLDGRTCLAVHPGISSQSCDSASVSIQFQSSSHACRHTAFQLLKLETLLNVDTLGYSALWVEPHALIAGTPLALISPKLTGLVMSEQPAPVCHWQPQCELAVL